MFEAGARILLRTDGLVLKPMTAAEILSALDRTLDLGWVLMRTDGMLTDFFRPTALTAGAGTSNLPVNLPMTPTPNRLSNDDDVRLPPRKHRPASKPDSHGKMISTGVRGPLLIIP